MMMQLAMIPESMLEERRRLGHDRFDEVWDGVLHMVPPASVQHMRLETELENALQKIVSPRGLHVVHEAGLYDPATPGHKNYRQPDVMIFAAAYVSDRGVEGRAELVIEIVSPNDESRQKLPFYAAIGVKEVWLLDPRARTVEVFSGLSPIEPDGAVIQAPALGLALSIEGATLHIRDGVDLYAVDIRDTF
jgi:Uma2 family endonuclease